MPDRRGAPARAWQRMLSGRRLDLLDPSPLDIEIEDIAHGLARVARWNGQTKGDFAFSVAQHSVLVTELLDRLGVPVDPDLRLAALLHDGAEYVIGDMISPFKSVVGGGYKRVEAALQQAIHIRFGLPGKLGSKETESIKRADQVAAWLEATQLAGFEDAEAAKYFGRPNGISIEHLDLTPLPSHEIQKRFVEFFNQVESHRIR